MWYCPVSRKPSQSTAAEEPAESQNESGSATATAVVSQPAAEDTITVDGPVDCAAPANAGTGRKRGAGEVLQHGSDQESYRDAGNALSS